MIYQVWKTKDKKIYCVVVILFLIAYLVLHLKAGMIFPLPFGDEAAFYYPAKAFSENNTLFTESLNSKREVFWMPPGFMIFSGLVFKLTGPSLIAGRWIAFTFSCLSFLLFCLLIARQTACNLYALLIIGLCFISRHWIYNGNIMRMDMMMLFVSLTGLFLVYRKKFLLGISFCIVSLAIHPNSIYFILLGLIYEFFIYKFQNIKSSIVGHQILPAVFVSILCLAYALHILPNLEFFVMDWKFQLSTRSNDGIRTLLFRWDQLVFLMVIIPSVYFIFKTKNEKLLFLILLAATLWILRVMGQGHSYAVFRIISVGLTAVVVHQLIIHHLSSVANEKKRILSVGSFLLLLLGMWAGKVINLPTRQGMVVYSFTMPSWSEYYYRKKDLEILPARINALCAGRPYIYFAPVSDGLIFDHIPNRKWTHRLNIFDTVQYDAFIIHQSRFNNFENVFETVKENYPNFRMEDVGQPIYQRDSTEKWYFVRNKHRIQ